MEREEQVVADYNAADHSKNMASGIVKPDHSLNYTITDSLGNNHEAIVSFKKIGERKLSVEFYFPIDEDGKCDVEGDNLIGHGELFFNEEYKFSFGSAEIYESFNIFWNNGSEPAEFSFDYDFWNKVPASIFGEASPEPLNAFEGGA